VKTLINKTIHYFWFGNNVKSDLIKKCINSWYEVLDDYQIIEWNEDNFDVFQNKFCETAYKNKKYAFVSDYARLKILKEYGGIYLDTDVLVKKKLNKFLNSDFFIGFMFDCNLSISLIGAKKNSLVINDLLNIYNKHNNFETPNNDLFTRFFLREYSDFMLNNTYQILDGRGGGKKENIKIYPKEYFAMPTYNKDMGYAIHYFNNSWREKRFTKIKKVLFKIIGEVNYFKLLNYKAVGNSPFYTRYKVDKNKYRNDIYGE